MLLNLLAWLLALPPIALLCILLVELIAGTLPGRRVHSDRMSSTARAAVLMPAHNEATGIAATIGAVLPQLRPGDRLVVVADNCSDETAAVARAAGATVIERQDAVLRGKGHALAFGRDWLRADAPDCVIVLDADCVMEGDGLARLIARCVTSGRPVQSCYLLRTGADDSPKVGISNFAFLVKNLVRQRGVARIGGPALLGGTGMGFPWALFKDAPLATSSVVEDLVLGIDFARAGHAPLFLEDARTWSVPATEQETRSQRTRWEHGFIGTALGQGLPLVGAGLAKARPALLWLGLHLLVPPLALLMMVALAALLATALLALLGASTLPPLLLLLLIGLTALTLGIAWSQDGRAVVSAATLTRIPLYLLWKLPVYLKLVRGRQQSEWVRTKRAGE